MAYPKGTYNIDVTITEGCTIDFDIPSAASSWVHINPQSGGSGRYVLTIDDGNHGDTTVGVYVNGNHCSSHDIEVTSPPVVTCGCGDLTIPETTYTWSATQGSSDTHNFTISSASCITNITKNSLSHFNATFGNGIVTVSPKEPNTGDQPHVETLTISYTADTNSCSSAITLTQNAPTCQQNSCTCYIVGAVSYPSSSDTQATVSWPYSAITWTTASTCDVTSALTTTDTSSTAVTYDPASCDKWIQSGTITWTGHKACGNKSCSSSDVTLSWSVDQGKPAGCDCSCSDITVSDDLTYNYTEHPGVLLGNIVFDSCVTDTGITFDWYGGRDWITNTGYSQNVLTGDIASYDSFEQDRYVLVTATGNTATEQGCSKTIKVTQTKNSVSCNCEDLIVTDTIVSTGTKNTVNWTSSADFAADETGETNAHIISYEIPSDKESCFENVTISIEPDEDYDEDVFSITPTSDGKGLKVYIKEEFENDMEAFITFKYVMSDGQSCTATGRNYISVVYNAACNCDKIYRDACILKTVPLTAGEFIIADGETNNCGYFSGFTSAYNDLKITQISTNNRGQVYVKANACDTEGAAGDIQIFFVNTVGGDKQCGGTRTLIRTANYVSCERFANAIFSGSYGKLTYTDTDTVRTVGYVWSSSSQSSYEAMKYYAEHNLLNFSGPSWITPISADTETSNTAIYIKGLVKGDSGDGGRTGTITVSLKQSVAKGEYGVCNCTTSHSWSVTEENKPTLECKCKNYADRDYTVLTYAGNDSKSYDYIADNCFKEGYPKWTLLNSTGGTLTDTDHYTEGQYVQLPGTGGWLFVAIKEDTASWHPGEHCPYVYYKWLAAGSAERTATIYMVTNIDLETECKMKITFTQPPLEDISCSDIPSKISISKPSESNAYTYEKHTNATVATYDETIEGVKISGDVVTGGDWITNLRNYNTKYLDGEISANTSSTPISLDFDGSTKSRSGQVKVYLVDNDGNKFVDKDGHTCEGDTYNIWQDGFSGYCPACNSIDISYILVDYIGYGDKMCPYDISNPSSEQVPAFSGNSSQERELFKVKLASSIHWHDSDAMRCFGLSAATNHTDVVSGSLWVDGPTRDGTSDDIYIVKGKLKPITQDVSPILIKLYIVKRGFGVRPDTICGGVNEFQEGHIKILKDINGECK